MVFFRMRLKKRFLSLTSGAAQEVFLSESLRLFRYDPLFYLPFWLACFGFSILFFWFGSLFFSCMVAYCLIFHIVYSFFSFFYRFISFYNKWF